jgi:thiamine biosynthesis lipoprotein
MRSLRRSGLMHKATGGAFDPACAPLVRAWGFGPGAGPVEGFEAPDGQQIEHLRRHSKWDNLQIDPDTNTVTRLHEAMEIDLSALAKGEGVDVVAEWLLRQGQASFLIEIGGDLRAGGGAPGRESWPVGIEHPDGSGAMLATLHLRDQSLATSGTYIQRRSEAAAENGNVRPTHVIDPRSGYPVGHETVSVSVVAESCAEADAWATALLVLGTEEGLVAAAEHKLPALFVVLDSAGTGEHLAVATPDFEELMQP